MLLTPLKIHTMADIASGINSHYKYVDAFGVAG